MENVQVLSQSIADKDEEISALKGEIKELKDQVMGHKANANAYKFRYEDRTTLLHKEREEAKADRVAILGPDCREKYLALFIHYGALLDSSDRQKAVQVAKAAKPTKKKAQSVMRQQGMF